MIDRPLSRPIYVFDLDGTLSNADHRKHMLDDPADGSRWRRFYAACGQDKPVPEVIRIMDVLRFVADVVIVSGRSDEVHAITVQWLTKYTSFMAHDLNIGGSVLYMRQADDHTPDDELKRRWLDALPQEQRNRIAGVFEDRARVVKMWRAAGIPCFQVADGDF